MAVAFVEKVFPLIRLRAQSGLIHCNSRSRCVGSPQSVFLEVLGTKKKTLFPIENKKVLFRIFQQECFSRKILSNFSLSRTMLLPTCIRELRTSKECWLNFEGILNFFFFTKACRFSANLFRSVLLGD